MAEEVASEDDILLQIQCLVSDSLDVVSYKWLSRKYSVSSNAAKRVLKKFSEQNENLDLEVVYALSGWSKEDPHSYVIQLVPKSKLKEATAALKEPPSIHVYSVQRCLPKDPAQLWSADFVQAEELFNEPADVDNCLRDNRFSAVVCKLVQRSSTRQNSHVTSPLQPLPPVSKGAVVIPPPSTTLVQKAPITPVTSLPPKNSDTVLKDAPGGKKQTKASLPPKIPHTESKDLAGAVTTGKRKASVVTPGNGGGGSLASMWGKAPAKSKAVVSPPMTGAKIMANPPSIAVLAGDAESLIQAMEAESGSDDDMATGFAAMRRGQEKLGGGGRRRMVVHEEDDEDDHNNGEEKNGGGQRRRMIVDEDDDDDDDDDVDGDDSTTIVRLGTPSPEKEKSSVATTSLDTPVLNKGASGVQDKSADLNQEILKVQGKPPKLEPNLQPKPDSNTTTTVQKVAEAQIVAEAKAHSVIPMPDHARFGLKRKKVLKSHIDERGREVTEVVWETEGEEKENIQKEAGSAAKQLAPSSKQTDVKPPTGKPQAGQKPFTAPSKASASKASTKTSAKSTGKPAKGQGNIMSFFKKT